MKKFAYLTILLSSLFFMGSELAASPLGDDVKIIPARVKIIPKFGYSITHKRPAYRPHYYAPPCYGHHYYDPYGYPPPPPPCYHYYAPRRQVEESFSFGFSIK